MQVFPPEKRNKLVVITLKEERLVENYGTLTVYAYTSASRIPVEGALVTISENPAPNAKIIASARTDRSGYIRPVRIPSPAFTQGLTPNNGTPFATVAVTITHPDYETEEISGVQVFPNTVTVQSFRMIPASYAENSPQIFDTPPQNL